MKLNELTNVLVTGLRGHGIEATPTTNTKNNGVVQHGLTLRRNDERVAPLFYINQFFERYKNGELSVDDILSQIIVEYEKLPTPSFPDINEMMSAPDFIDKITLRLVNEPANRSTIECRNLVHHQIAETDLVVLFYATVVSDENSSGSIAITEELMKRYLPNVVDGDDLYEKIIHRKSEVVKFESIGTVLERMMRERLEEIPQIPFEDDFMFVLTNGSTSYGAGALFTDAAREEILKKFPEGEVTVLPSSVHETLILKTCEDENIEMLQEMVYSVNRAEVSREEFLSDDVFHYNAKTGKLVRMF